MSLSGSIEDLPLLEILQVVAYCQKTGHLVVRAPQGEAGVIFDAGRVVSGYIWEAAARPLPPPGTSGREQRIRDNIAEILDQLVRLREGEFQFNLTSQPPARLGGRDLTAEMLADGINPEELMLDLARKLDEDRRECAATLEASFSAPAPEPPSAALPPEASVADAAVSDALDAEALDAEAPEATDRRRPAVLLVDDEAEVCRVVGTQLDQAGYEVIVAAGAAHARRQMLQLAFERRRFLLVVDLGLPSEGGASFRAGLDVVRQAAGIAPPPPVLLMAESLDERLRSRARRLGVSLIAFKPGLSKLEPLQYQADLRAFGDKLATDLLPRLEGRVARPAAQAPPAETSAPDEPTRALRGLQAALAEVESQPDPDSVAFLLLRAARAFFTRAVLLVLKDDCLRGLSGFGPTSRECGLDLVARELSASLDEPSPLADAVASGRHWTGSLPPEGPLRAFVEAIGPLAARSAVIAPLRVSRQVFAVVYGDRPDGSALPSPEAFVGFVDQAGRALERALAVRRAAARAS